jgi:hypothetical protein
MQKELEVCFSGTAPALQVQSSEFKPQNTKKRKKSGHKLNVIAR